MDELGRLDKQAFGQVEKNQIVLVLDNIRSMHNVGSAFRTADAFALQKILLCGITAQPPHREIEKTALGATQTVNWEYRQDVKNALTELKEEGYTILAAEQTDESVYLHDFDFSASEKYALVFGNEVEGVSDEALQVADFAVEIPQFGTKHSLNVSVATGIVIWEIISRAVLTNNPT